MVLWISCCVMAMARMPLAAALGTVAVQCVGFALTDDSRWGAWVTTAAVVLAGYSLRLDAHAKGTGYRLLPQERAAREAEATSAGLAERARIAREIHDVLAHSLSAQHVHLKGGQAADRARPRAPLPGQAP
ncbi:signal transduction histidine kinase [Streptomyces sp. V4I23]|nr:signal transduction histidine kinase [Streptomyces sp. V4I23]